MNAVISGTSGIALVVVDADRLYSFHVDTPERKVVRSPEEYPLLFGSDGNVEFLEDMQSVDEVLARLRKSVARERALHLALLLIDGAWSVAARSAAAIELDSLLVNADHERHVLNVLYALPLPPGEAVQSALVLSGGSRVRALLAGLIRAQGAIAETRAAWDLAIEESVPDAEERIDARARAVRDGMFRSMVVFHDRGVGLDVVQAAAKAGPFGDLRHWQDLLTAWAAPMQRHRARFDEIVATYWGYLDHLRLPRPKVNPHSAVSPLAWPKTDRSSGAERSRFESPVERTGERAEEQRRYREEVERLNARIEGIATKISKIRFLRRLPSRLYPALLLLSASAWVVVKALWPAHLDVTVFLTSVAAIASAIVVFQMLNAALGGSRKSLNRWIAAGYEDQARREEGDLRFAASQSPALAGLGSRARVTPAGWLRILVPDVESLPDRSFSIAVDGKEMRYVGTGSAVLSLAPGHHAVEIVGARDGGLVVRQRTEVVVQADEIQERTVVFQ